MLHSSDEESDIGEEEAELRATGDEVEALHKRYETLEEDVAAAKHSLSERAELKQYPSLPNGIATQIDLLACTHGDKACMHKLSSLDHKTPGPPDVEVPPYAEELFNEWSTDFYKDAPVFESQKAAPRRCERIDAAKKWMGRGMPGLMVVLRKPTPVGLEIHTLCCAICGVMIWFEVYEGARHGQRVHCTD